MRFLVTGISWGNVPHVDGLPDTVNIELAEPEIEYDSMELVAAAIKEQTGVSPEGWVIKRNPSAYDLGTMVGDAIDKGRLAISDSATATLLVATGLAAERGCMEELYTALERLCRVTARQDVIKLWADGPSDKCSFGVGWYHGKPKYEGSEYVELAYDKAYMVGGLIYRGPETNANYKDRTWSIHT